MPSKVLFIEFHLVDGVSIIDNSDGKNSSIPPHSFACYVLAPESQYDEIAKAIFDKNH